MSVCCPAVVVTAKWVVSCTRITCIQPLSRCPLTFPASFLFRKFVSLFSTISSFFSFLSLAYWPFRTRLLACLIRAAIFRLPSAFVVWSFFLCHRHLWSVLSFFATGICVRSLSFTAFSAVGIRVRLFVFALLALVSGYQCISQFFVSCCDLSACQLHPWRFELDFFPSRLPCGQPYKFRFEANPIWYSTIKFTQLHSAKCSLHKWV